MSLVSPFRQSARRAFVGCSVFLTTLFPVLAQTPSAADGFAADVDGNVYVLATQADGKVIVGGQFTTIRNANRNNLARLNPDGSLDASFNPNPNGPVRAAVIQTDGRIVIGGDFTGVQAATRNRIARLNADGTPDATFNPNLGGALQPQVHALLLQPDGRIIAGGSFTTAGGVTRNRIARFNANGTLDAGFDPNANGMVLALALHANGKILVGGGFTTLQSPGESAATTRNRIARLNSNGSVDSEFNPNANNAVTTLTVQRDGKIVLGGYFTTLQPVDSDVVNRTRVARLNADGSVDSEFFPNVNGPVAIVAVQPDGGILVGGAFNTAWGRGAASSSRGNLARFNPDGALDPDFNPNFNAQIDALAFQAEGKIVVGGYFTRVQPPAASAAIVRNRLARLNADGSLDTAFELNAGGRVLASAVQSDGKILVAGSFTNVGGATHNHLARLNADGSVDATYNPDFNERVFTIAIQPDGKAIVGGSFTTIGGETRSHIARLNPSGTIDSEFYPSIDGPVGAILLQSDGRILVGGTFTSVLPVRGTETVLRSNLLRLNADGTLDTTFNPTPNSSVAALALQSDGKILLGGSFSTLTPNGVTSPTQRNFFARINADGTLDTAFSAAVNGRISAIALQSDAKIIIGGAFTAVLPTGATLSTEQVVRNRIARLNADGTVDTAYDPNANDNVLALALQPDGKLILGGSFTTLQPAGDADWTLRKYAARLNTDGKVDSSFNLDINEAPGNRVDSLRLLADGRLLIGGNFTSFQPTGTPTRITRSTFARINANGTVDTTFTAGAGGAARGQINALAVQADNKIIAVGSFSDLGSAKTTNIARFTADGSPDTAFTTTAATDGPINAIAVRPNPSSTAAPVAGFAWLNRDGTLRSGFSGRGARLSGQINAAVVHPNGGLLVGGAFTNLANTTGGNLVRFNADGSLDENFNPAPTGGVSLIAIQPDGRILIAGSFSIVNGAVRNRIARLNADGSLDSGFDPNANGNINALVLEADGKMIVGGTFTSFTPNAATTAVARNFIARVNSDGTIDANYNPNVSAPVYALTLQGDGKVIAGGAFTTAQPNTATTATVRNSLARFNTDGTLDTNFDPNVNGPVYALAAQPNGQIVVGGAFTTLQPGATGTVYSRDNIARVNSDGAVDTTFDPNANAAIHAVALQSDGSVLLAGDFTILEPANATGPVSRHHLARVNNTGALDLSFNPDVTGNVFGVAALADGGVLVSGDFTGLQLSSSIVIGGNFGTVGGIPLRNLATLTRDGSVSTSFQPNPNGAVNALLAQPDGKVIVGGAFTSIAGVARSRIARFNDDGTLDRGFNPTLTGAVNALALQPDGKVLLGGAFTASGLIRLNADSSADASFAANVTAPVTAVAVHHSGQIVYVTNRSALAMLKADGSASDTPLTAATTTSAFLTLAVQADGGIIVGGTATISTVGGVSSGGITNRPFLARFRPDGTIDAAFNPAPNAGVTAIALQSDGRIVVGGNFGSIGGETRYGIARLAATGTVTEAIGVTADRRSVTWVRNGGVGEVVAVTFELSTDGSTWTPLGLGTPGADTWTLSGLSLPANGLFYIRARGIAPSSGGTSSGVFEMVREFNFASAPFAPVVAGDGSARVPEGFAINPFTGIVSGTLPTPVRPPGAASIITGSGDTVEIVVQGAPTGTGSAHLANLSTRGRVTAESPLILGFAISGTESRSVLMRAVGPALAGFGVSDALRGTRLQVYDSTGAQVASDHAPGTSEVAEATARTGAFPLAAGSADSAAVMTLAPGVYTMQVVDTIGTGGVALAEIYDAGTGAGSRLVNVSSRGGAGAGDSALISGFVISGDAAKRVLLRAVGPTLAQFGAGAVVADPAISLYNSAGVNLGTNDNWVSGVAQIITAAMSAGAFPLEPGSKDAAVIATLPPGAYTIQVSAQSGAAATALLEIYEVP